MVARIRRHRRAAFPLLLTALGLRPPEAAFAAGFGTIVRPEQLAAVRPDIQIVIAGSTHNLGSRRTRRGRARYRVGCEGRIAHLKREYGAGTRRGEERRGKDGPIADLSPSRCLQDPRCFSGGSS